MSFILAAVFATLISGFSLFLGYLFALSTFGKISISYPEKKVITIILMVIAAVMMKMFNLIDYVRLNDIFFGVIASGFLYINILNYTQSYSSTIFFISVFHLTYALVRYVVLGEQYFHNMEIMLLERMEMLQDSFGRANFQDIKQGFTQAFQIYRNFNIAIWATGMVIGNFLGCFIISKKRVLKFFLPEIRLPKAIIYYIIVSLCLAVVPGTKTIGYNLLIVAAILCSIQGISVLSFWWLVYFARSKLVLYLFFIMIFFNFFFVIVISFIGLLDLWFDLRKYNKKIGGKNENNSA